MSKRRAHETQTRVEWRTLRECGAEERAASGRLATASRHAHSMHARIDLESPLLQVPTS